MAVKDQKIELVDLDRYEFGQAYRVITVSRNPGPVAKL